MSAVYILAVAATLGLLAERATVVRVSPRSRPLCAALPDDELDRLFFDRAELFVRSGAGGKGAVGFRSRKPAGGNGGAGGNVFLVCDSSVNTLGHFRGRMSVRAEPGTDANSIESGRAAPEVLVKVPPNCRVTDAATDALIKELVNPGDRLLIASGGAGGEGNGDVFKRTGTDSHRVTPPGGTERRKLLLSMTLVADVGLVGFPNAGKSTLISAVTRARPKVADYPFTTLVPNLGVCEPYGAGSGQMLLLDIPGLIQGASEGKGLGLAFLRHTEGCRLLIHLVSGESETPAADFVAINRELEQYSPRLAGTPQVVVLSKVDLPHVAARVPAALEALRAVVPHGRILCISAHTGLNVDQLVSRTYKLLRQQAGSQKGQLQSSGNANGAEGLVPTV